MNINERIERIVRMEQYLDTLKKAFFADPSSLSDNKDLYDMLHTLIRYYNGPEWMEDFECDERGELPHDLKRGVLSEDEMYDFLAEITTFFE